MKTPFLDKIIEELENHIEHVEAISYDGIPETRKELAEYKAIKEALSIANVSDTHIFKKGDGVVIIDSGIMGEVCLTNGKFLRVKLSDGTTVSKQTYEVRFVSNYKNPKECFAS